MAQLPVLHIGYPKAASKTLQFGLFDRHSQIDNLGKPLTDQRVPQWLHAVHAHDSVEYDADAARRGYDELVAPRLRPDKTLAVSYEAFTLPVHADRGLIADRLHALFGPAKIVVNIRSQLDQLKSAYAFQHTRAKHALSFEDYVEQNWNKQVNSWVTYLDYQKLIHRYVSLFGRENVGVFLFEDLVQNSENYARQVCGFIGIDAAEGVRHLAGEHGNKARSARLGSYTRLRKWFAPDVAFRKYVPSSVLSGFHAFIERGEKLRVNVPDALADRIRDRFRDSNRLLAREFGLPLAERGYPT